MVFVLQQPNSIILLLQSPTQLPIILPDPLEHPHHLLYLRFMLTLLITLPAYSLQCLFVPPDLRFECCDFALVVANYAIQLLDFGLRDKLMIDVPI